MPAPKWTEPDLRRETRNAMRELLGSGYVDSYYDSAGSNFVGLAEWWASVEVSRLSAELDDTRAQLAAVKRLHVPYDCTEAGNEGHETCGEREWCYSCGESQPWPCMTFQAIRDAALGGEPETAEPAPVPPASASTEPSTGPLSDPDAGPSDEPARCPHGKTEAHYIGPKLGETFGFECRGPAASGTPEATKR